MGSSKSGSLDKFASFSPAAALASGKVKLPETGLIGMMQGQAEDDKVYQQQRLANQVAYQDQMKNQQQYMNQMQQQMQANMQPRPYANGGHVALRRKMFKLGGDTNTHGTGLTSGLSYQTGDRVGFGSGGYLSYENLKDQFERLSRGSQLGLMDASTNFSGSDAAMEGIMRLMGMNEGGRVGMASGGMSYLEALEEKMSKFKSGAASAGEKLSKSKVSGKKGILSKGLGLLLSSIFGKAGPAIGKSGYRTIKTGKLNTNPIKAFLRANPRTGKALLATAGMGGGLGAASAVSNILPDFEEFGQSEDSAPFAKLIAGAREDLLDPFISITPAGGLSYGFTGDTLGSTLRELGGKEPRSVTEDLNIEDIPIGEEPVDFAAQQAELRKQQMQEAMQMYQDLMDTGDNSQKFRDLGDALISGGAALMEGEGYGGAAMAFNEPLSAARARSQERQDAIQQMAASQAIADVSGQDQLMQAAIAEQIGAGDYSLAEATQKFSFAQQNGVNTLLPTDEKGEIDKEALAQLKGKVVADITNATGRGGVFVAIANDGEIRVTNDIEVANRHAAS
jgi:hypothetical protein